MKKLLQILMYTLIANCVYGQLLIESDTLYHYKDNTLGIPAYVNSLLTSTNLQKSGYGWQVVPPCLLGYSGYALTNPQPIFNPLTNPYVQFKIESAPSVSHLIQAVSLKLRGGNVGANLVRLAYSLNNGLTWVTRNLPDSPNLTNSCGQTNSIQWQLPQEEVIGGSSSFLFRIYYFHTLSFVGGNNQLLDLVVHGQIDDPVEFYSLSSGNLSDPIWNANPNGAIGYSIKFKSTITAHVQSGHHVRVDSRDASFKNLFIQFGGRLYSGVNNPLITRNVNIFETLFNSGMIGDSLDLDVISLNAEGPNVVFNGNGKIFIGRISKSFSNSPNTILSLATQKTHLRYPGNCLFNNASNTNFNIVLQNNSKLFVEGSNSQNGDVWFDGVSGNSLLNMGVNFNLRGELSINGSFKPNSANNSALYGCSLSSQNGSKLFIRNADLIINSLNSINFVLGSQIKVSGSLKILNGTLITNNTLTILSGGNVLHGNGISELLPYSGGLISGGVKFMTNGHTDLGFYNYWSSPINNSTLLPLALNNLNNGNPVDIYFYDPLETTSSTIEGLRQGWVPQMQTDFMANSRGYIATAAGNVTFNGALNNGNIQVPLTLAVHTRFNLVGNPYPGPINANSFLTQNISSIIPAVYMWDDDGSLGTNYAASDYVVTNSAGTLATGGNGNNSQSYSGTIAACQSFFVEAKAGANMALFKNQMRTSQSSHFYESDTNLLSKYWIRLTDAFGAGNQILIAFSSLASDSYDEFYDAKKLFLNDRISFASKLDEENYAIQTLENDRQTKSVELTLKIQYPGFYQFSIPSSVNVDESVMVFLEDKFENHFYLMNNNSIGIDIEDVESAENRFRIVFKPSIVFDIVHATCGLNNGSVNFSGLSECWTLRMTNQLSLDSFQINSIESELELPLGSGSYSLRMSNCYGIELLRNFEISDIGSINAQLNVVEELLNLGDFLNAEVISIEPLSYTWFLNNDLQPSSTNSLMVELNELGIHELKVDIYNGECDTTLTKSIAIIGPNYLGHHFDSAGEVDFLVKNSESVIEVQNLSKSNSIYFEVYSFSGQLIYEKHLKQQFEIIPILDCMRGPRLMKIRGNENETLFVTKTFL